MLHLVQLALLAISAGSFEFTVNVSVFGCETPLPARCSCLRARETVCRVERARVNGIDAELEAAVLTHLGRPADLRVIPYYEAALGCAEDRSTSERAGSWGGDAGEIILSLVVAESVREQPLAPAQVAAFVRAYVSKTRSAHVYWHTTARAAAWVQAHVAEEDWREALDFTRPLRALQPRLLSALHDPRGQGCSLLRGLLTRASRFHARLELVHSFIDAFHLALWDPHFEARDKIQYNVDREGGTGGCGAHRKGNSFTPLERSPQPPTCPRPSDPGFASAPLPYGRFTAVLSSPGGRLDATEARRLDASGQQASLVLRPLARSDEAAGGRCSGSSGSPTALPTEAPTTPVPFPPTLLRVFASDACTRMRRTPLVAPNAGTPGARVPFLVVHPQAVAARRNATVPLLLAAAPGSDGQQVRNALHDLGAAWARALEAELGVEQVVDVVLGAAA